MSNIKKIENRTQEIKSEFSDISSVDPHTTSRHQKDRSNHSLYWAIWGVGIVLLAGIIAGALWFGVVKGGVTMTSTGLYGIVVMCFILFTIMLIFRPE